MSMGFRPKKRLFIALASLAVLLAAGAGYGLWQIMVPGLTQLHPWLPRVVGWGVLLVILALCSGVVGIVLAILGFPTIRFFYFWAWHIISLFYPLALLLGKLRGFPNGGWSSPLLKSATIWSGTSISGSRPTGC